MLDIHAAHRFNKVGLNIEPSGTPYFESFHSKFWENGRSWVILAISNLVFVVYFFVFLVYFAYLLTVVYTVVYFPFQWNRLFVVKSTFYTLLVKQEELISDNNLSFLSDWWLFVSRTAPSNFLLIGKFCLSNQVVNKKQ